jgi:lycopene beta-cyclase
VLRVGVYRRWPRLLAAITPAALLGVLWDGYAVHVGQWGFDHHYLVGIWFGGLPLEEVLFFVVIPVCAVLTFEAVRRTRPDWLAGSGSTTPTGPDEPGAP